MTELLNLCNIHSIGQKYFSILATAYCRHLLHECSFVFCTKGLNKNEQRDKMILI